MSSKFSLIPAVKDHYATLSDSRTGAFRAGDYIVTLGLPVVAGAVAYWREVDLADVSAIIGGVAILTGLLFALVIFVFQLRLQIAQDLRSTTNDATVELINQLFRNLIYAVVVGLACTTVAIVADAAQGDAKPAKVSDVAALAAPIVMAPAQNSIGVVWSAVLIALGVHLLTILAMCLKRLGSAYSKMTI